MKYFLIFLFISASLTAQVGYVEYNHPVFPFLERMHTVNLIDNYDPFELPKTRNEISNYLKHLESNLSKLNNVDKRILKDFLIEFEYDLHFSTDNYNNLFTPFGVRGHGSQKEKFLFYSTDSSNFNIFINFIGGYKYIYENNRLDTNRNVSIINYGGMARGTFLNNFGYMLNATNGTFAGDKSLAANHGSLRYNYKFNKSGKNNGGADYFDETEGYLMAQFDFFNLKIGRDRMNIGYGPVKSIMSDNPPRFDYLSLNLNYGIFSFSYLHGKLLGNETNFNDPQQGNLRSLSEKYLAYHRFNFEFSRHFTLGLGEMVIYSRRSMDISYLNPFNYYKSIEHSNQDRDNSLLFLDVKNNSVKGLSFYTTLIIDDLDFSKLNTDWYGNRFLFNFGLQTVPFYKNVPLVIDLQYLRIDPYFYSHRINDNKYTTLNFKIGPDIEPNSESFFAKITYLPHHRLTLKFSFQYINHGANDLSENGSVLVNYGGDILVGHRTEDATEINFLDGIPEHSRQLGFSARYEPVNNYFIDLSIKYRNATQSFGNDVDLIESILSLFFKL